MRNSGAAIACYGLLSSDRVIDFLLDLNQRVFDAHGIYEVPANAVSNSPQYS